MKMKLKDLVPMYSRYIQIQRLKLDDIGKLLEEWEDKVPVKFSRKMKELLENEDRPQVIQIPESFKMRYEVKSNAGSFRINCARKAEVEENKIRIGNTTIILEDLDSMVKLT